MGLEYARAILKENRKKNVTLLPVQRLGDYKKQTLATNGAAEYSSASSIRLAMEKGDFAALSSELPACVSADIQSAGIAAENLKTAERIAVLKARKNELALTADISEGLENALKKAAVQPEDIVTQLTSKRYTASRINRILLQNLLDIRKDLLADCLSAPLYVQPLAIGKERKDLLSVLSGGEFPCVMRYADEQKLTGTARRCFQADKLAENIYSAVTGFYGGTKNVFY